MLLQLEDQLNQRVALAFFRLGRFQFIQGTPLTAVLKEARFDQGGPVDDGTAARLGRQLGAAQVLVGASRAAWAAPPSSRPGFSAAGAGPTATRAISRSSCAW